MRWKYRYKQKDEERKEVTARTELPFEDDGEFVKAEVTLREETDVNRTMM